MELRRCRVEDLAEIRALFTATILTVNRRDYTDVQVRAWAGAAREFPRRQSFFLDLYTLVALEGTQLVGYGNIHESGYLDHLFVHRDHQGRGIATALCDALEAHAAAGGVERVTVHASLTARPFFLGRGYRLLREQKAEVGGVFLKNCAMEKPLVPGLESPVSRK